MLHLYLYATASGYVLVLQQVNAWQQRAEN